MIINARLREFLHELGHLDRFIKNVEANPNAPKVIQSIAEALSAQRCNKEQRTRYIQYLVANEKIKRCAKVKTRRV